MGPISSCTWQWNAVDDARNVSDWRPYSTTPMVDAAPADTACVLVDSGLTEIDTGKIPSRIGMKAAWPVGWQTLRQWRLTFPTPDYNTRVYTYAYQTGQYIIMKG
jgi:hypothetical protein